MITLSLNKVMEYIQGWNDILRIKGIFEQINIMVTTNIIQLGYNIESNIMKIIEI